MNGVLRAGFFGSRGDMLGGEMLAGSISEFEPWVASVEGASKLRSGLRLMGETALSDIVIRLAGDLL